MKHIRAFVKSSLQLDNDHAQTLNNHHVKVVGTSSGMQHIRAFVQSSLHLDTSGAEAVEML